MRVTRNKKFKRRCTLKKQNPNEGNKVEFENNKQEMSLLSTTNR
jgi:hypothetical protein